MTAFTRSPKTPVVVEDATSAELGNECREAALAFLRGVTAGWDKIDLVLWLTGDYARATSHVPRGERVASLGAAEVDVAALDELLDRSRAQLLAWFEQAALDGNLACAHDCLRRGLVREATTADGEKLYVPVDAPRMRLRDRLASLVAADYLNQPGEYLSLYVCHRCENVAFDERAKRLGFCRAHHHRPSGIRNRTTPSA